MKQEQLSYYLVYIYWELSFMKLKKNICFGDTKDNDSLIFCAFCGENQVKSVLATKQEHKLYSKQLQSAKEIVQTGHIRRILDGTKCTFFH